jgi:serine protease inhibitor
MKLTENLKVTFIPELESDVLELPYQNEEISMIIVLPSNNSDVFKVEKNLRNFDARFLVRNLDLINSSSVEVILPKFEKGIFVKSLIEELTELEVIDLFINPNLTNMIDDDELFAVSQMDHLGGIKVNEGSQSAEIKTSNVSSIDNEFVVDKPFIFYIYDRINHLPILFGRIVDPNGKRSVEQYDVELGLQYMDEEEEEIEPTDETPLPAAANMDVQTTEKAETNSGFQ